MFRLHLRGVFAAISRARHGSIGIIASGRCRLRVRGSPAISCRHVRWMQLPQPVACVQLAPSSDAIETLQPHDSRSSASRPSELRPVCPAGSRARYDVRSRPAHEQRQLNNATRCGPERRNATTTRSRCANVNALVININDIWLAARLMPIQALGRDSWYANKP